MSTQSHYPSAISAKTRGRRTASRRPIRNQPSGAPSPTPMDTSFDEPSARHTRSQTHTTLIPRADPVPALYPEPRVPSRAPLKTNSQVGVTGFIHYFADQMSVGKGPVKEGPLSSGFTSIHPLSQPSSSSPVAFSFMPRYRVMTAQGHHPNAWARGKSYRRTVTISVLPDDVLLEIFDFCRKNDVQRLVMGWHVLVHVCQRWRQIVFESRHRLGLQILCTYGTPVRKSLGSWPAFPIVLKYGHPRGITPFDEDSVITALEHSDRVCEVRLNVTTGSQLGNLTVVMQEPFPALTHLALVSQDGNAPVIPGSFLGGSAPSLQKLNLSGIPYPALPKLLLAATGLVELKLDRIPSTGYISPEAMVTGLAALTSLRSLFIAFQSPKAHPNQILLPPETRTALPTLTSFVFDGVREYLEDFAARIDAPRLDSICVYYFNQLSDFHVPQLSRFIGRSEIINQSHFRRCDVTLGANRVSGSFYVGDARIDVCIRCQGIDWQVSHITQVFTQISPVFFDVVHFEITTNWFEPPFQLEDMDEIEWLELFRQLTSVRSLFVSGKLSGNVIRALGDVVEVLPALDVLCSEDQPASTVSELDAARRLSGRPVSIVTTRREFHERLN